MGYCGKHRLPESHSCENMVEVREGAHQKLAGKLLNEKCVAIDSLDIGTIEGQIGELKDYFWVSVPVEAPVSSSILHKRLDSHPHVQWVERQLPVKRLFKRDKISDVRKKLDIKDPEFGNQWHIINTETAGYDLSCTGVWEQGITGTGVTVGFIDDGLDHENPDLKENFSLEGSYDFNYHKKLPTPALWDDTHGTRCAGEVGAVKNEVCGVGIAYTSKVAGTEFQLTTSPPEIVTKAIENGIKNGRNGLGSLLVFGAGNGGSSGDNCRPDLNWRDAQRLSIENALVVNAKDTDWKPNGAKRLFNHKYGYGTYDTWKIIEAAMTFVSVNPQVSVSVPSGSIGLPIPQTDEGLIDRIKIDQALIDGVGLKRLEHVSVTVNIEHQNRGDVAIYLKSPDQFVSRLIESRRLDDSTSGFANWTMMSVAHWLEI
ncbi:pheromone processing endoprotease [Globomyces sp. JEL0801]|nr:pheromone processing endoprotease [Globomyces sp. JEL0801]